MLSPSQKKFKPTTPNQVSPDSCPNLQILPGDTSSMNFLYPNDKWPLTRPYNVPYSSVVHELTLKKKLWAQATAQAQAYANAQAHAHALGNAMGNAKAKA